MRKLLEESLIVLRYFYGLYESGNNLCSISANLINAIELELSIPEKQPLAAFTVKDGKVIGYTLTNGELPNGDYEIYAKDEL